MFLWKFCTQHPFYNFSGWRQTGPAVRQNKSRENEAGKDVVEGARFFYYYLVNVYESYFIITFLISQKWTIPVQKRNVPRQRQIQESSGGKGLRHRGKKEKKWQISSTISKRRGTQQMKFCASFWLGINCLPLPWAARFMRAQWIGTSPPRAAATVRSATACHTRSLPFFNVFSSRPPHLTPPSPIHHHPVVVPAALGSP